MNNIVNERSANNFLELENIIKNHIDRIGKTAQELKQKREMLKDGFDNDPTYREHTLKVKEASKAKSIVRKQIAQQPSVALLAQEVKDTAFDLKEQKATLSDLLLDYKEKTQATQLELFNGEVVEIVQSAKIVKR